MAEITVPIGATADNPFIGNRRGALAAGARYYVNPRRSCIHGHTPTVRLASNTGCIACHAAWWDKNTESQSAKGKAFRIANPEVNKIQQKRKYAKDRQKYRDMVKDYTSRNKEKVGAYNLEWRKANREHLANYYEEWRVANPEAVAAKAHKRRAAKLGSAEHFTKADVQAAYDRQKGRCHWCRADISKGYEIDHVMPLALGGDNSRRNIALACVPCNRGKSKTHPIDFARKRLGLLL